MGLRRGDEADKIRAFKDALGLSDEDAAPAHIDVGRRIMRSRFEASTRAGNSDSFRALQKLIYVSDLVFGVQKVRVVQLHASGAVYSHLCCCVATNAQVEPDICCEAGQQTHAVYGHCRLCRGGIARELCGGSVGLTEAHQHCACLQAAFLLPWRRIFNLSDSQLYVAKRENAKALFRSHIESKGNILQVLTTPHLLIVLVL